VPASPFAGYEVDEEHRPIGQLFDYDLERALSSVIVVEATIPADAMSARTLGTERMGNAIIIDDDLLLTIGYLLTEADDVNLTTNDGRQIPAHTLAIDQPTGFGLIHALEPLDLPSLRIGDSRKVRPEAAVVAAGAGGRAHSLSGHVLARQPFAGYWEYFLEEALFVEPAHPHWNGAALIGPAGELIGVGSLRMEHQSPSGEGSPLNMYVPAELLPPLLPDLSRGKPAHAPRPWLGVTAAEVHGHVVITDVTSGGPAARAELRRADIVHRVAGKRVKTLAGFYKALWALGPPGVTLPLTIQREQDVFDVEVRSGDRLSLQRKRRLH
jgi:S1-C subfamily serine protease